MLGLIGLKSTKFGSSIDPERACNTFHEPQQDNPALNGRQEDAKTEEDSIASLKERVRLPARYTRSQHKEA